MHKRQRRQVCYQYGMIAPHPLTRDYSPNCHVRATGDGKPNAVPRKSLDNRHLPCSSLILSLIVSCEGATPMKITSFRCLQMHKKTWMMAVHISLSWGEGQTRVVHQSTKPASTAGTQAGLPQCCKAHAQTSRATIQSTSKCLKVSGSWSQKGQADGCCIPRRWSHVENIDDYCWKHVSILLWREYILEISNLRLLLLC
jgi:hypothetical protein